MDDPQILRDLELEIGALQWSARATEERARAKQLARAPLVKTDADRRRYKRIAYSAAARAKAARAEAARLLARLAEVRRAAALSALVDAL